MDHIQNIQCPKQKQPHESRKFNHIFIPTKNKKNDKICNTRTNRHISHNAVHIWVQKHSQYNRNVNGTKRNDCSVESKELCALDVNKRRTTFNVNDHTHLVSLSLVLDGIEAQRHGTYKLQTDPYCNKRKKEEKKKKKMYAQIVKYIVWVTHCTTHSGNSLWRPSACIYIYMYG